MLCRSGTNSKSTFVKSTYCIYKCKKIKRIAIFTQVITLLFILALILRSSTDGPRAGCGPWSLRIFFSLFYLSTPMQRSIRLWSRTLDRCTKMGLPECVVSTLSRPPQKTTQDGTETKDTPSPRKEINISDQAGNGTRAEATCCKAGPVSITTRRRTV